MCVFKKLLKLSLSKKNLILIVSSLFFNSISWSASTPKQGGPSAHAGDCRSTLASIDVTEASIFTEEGLRLYFLKVRELSQFIVDELNAAGGSAHKSLRAPNFYYGRISHNGGIVLTMHNGIPTSFWTPFGELMAVRLEDHLSNAPLTSVVNVITERLGLIKIEIPEEEHRNTGFSGTIYAVTRDLDGHSLPFPEQLTYQDSEAHVGAEALLWEKIKPEGMAAPWDDLFYLEREKP